MSTNSNGAVAASPNGTRQDGYRAASGSPAKTVTNSTTKTSGKSDKSNTDFPSLPPAPAPHVFGTGYSGRHKVPKAQDWTDIRQSHQEQADEYARILDMREQAAEDERRIMEEGPTSEEEGEPAYVRVDANGDPINPPNSATSAGTKASKDGKQSQSKADDKTGANEKQRLMNQMTSFSEKPTDRIKKAHKGERRVRDPITGGVVVVKDADPKDFEPSRTRISGGNVAYYPYPPPAPASVTDLIKRCKQVQYLIIGSCMVLWFFVAFGNGLMTALWRSFLLMTIGIGLYAATGLLIKNLEKEIDAIRLDLSRSRGQAFSPPYPESAEWLNGLIRLVWGQIDPGLFVPMADMIEDILQASLPSFVDAVRITDLSQGYNPLIISSLRALPDLPGDEGYPKTSWIDEGTGEPSKEPNGDVLKEDQAGDYYNFEVAFQYSAQPGQTDREKNIHLLIEFYLGSHDWFHIPLPIWIQIEQIFGIARVRLQFIPEPPFVRNCTFALCGVPSVEVSAIPMSRHLPNVLDLPLISGFVKSAIAAGTSELCVPKSMTINLKDMLSGAAVGDTRAIGVFLITIHYCEGLSAQDNNGKSDPYIVLAYAKYGRPLYSTRIIIEDLNPVYEETATLQLTEDEIRSDEDLAVMLWDSDKMSADDLVGRVQIPVKDLIKHPNRMFDRIDGLRGFEDGEDMPGTINWSIGFFDKVPLKKSNERLPTVKEARNDPGQKSAARSEMLPGDIGPNPARDYPPPPPPDVTKTHPDDAWPSGVLSIILHQVQNLERQQLEGKSGTDREGEAGQDTDDPSEQTKNLPCGYGEFIVNDELCYKTRVKQYTTNPYFDAGTEIFVRDFTTTEVRVVIRDSRLRESDPIMGVVSVNLADVFCESSSVTQTYPIQEGVGFGKANISFAFRSVRTKLPVNMRGWSTGTVAVQDIVLRADPSKRHVFEAERMALSVSTHEWTEKLSKRHSEAQGGAVSWNTDHPEYFPVYNRYQSHIVFEFGSSGVGSLIGKGKPEAIAVLWLQDLTDDIEGEVEIPVITGPHLNVLRQNVINDQTLKHHKFEVVGSVSARMTYSAGLDIHHEKLRLSQSRRHAFEAWMATEGEAEISEMQKHYADDGVIDRHEKHEIEKAHRRQLESRGRGMAQVGAYRSAKWIGRGIRDRLPGRKKTRERESLVQSETDPAAS